MRHPAVTLWHVGNEYGCHLRADYSDAARDAYRGWLRARYGTIAALNEAHPYETPAFDIYPLL